MASNASATNRAPQAQVQPCRYKTGKTLGAGSYSVVKECVHVDTGRYYAAKVINKRLMAGREHMVRSWSKGDEAFSRHIAQIRCYGKHIIMHRADLRLSSSDTGPQ